MAEFWRGDRKVSTDAQVLIGQRTLTGAGREDVWAGATATRPTPGGIQLRLVSAGAADDVAGTGVRRVRIDYLGAGGVRQFEVVDLDGVVAVLTVATDIGAVLAITATEVGSGGAAAGVISVTNVGVTETYDQIAVGDVQARAAVWVVPGGKQFWIASVKASASAAAVLRAVSNFNPITRQVVTDGQFVLAEVQVGAALMVYTPAVDVGPIPAGARVWLSAQGAGNPIVNATLEGYQAPAV